MASGRCTIRIAKSLRGTARLQRYLFGQPGTSVPGNKPRVRARQSAVHGRQCTDRSECVSKFPPRPDRRGIAAPGKAAKGPGAGAVEYVAGQGAALGRVPIVQWYPGHIAKAERQLKQQLKLVDVVLEVRDARIPVATWHPGVKGWIGNKPRLLILNRADMISREDMSEWEAYFGSMGETLYWTVGNRGDGTQRLVRAMMKVSKVVNEKRRNRGLNPRAVRACVIGFPNIGKSALINRLVKRRVVDSAPRPGVTRALRWVRMGGNIDMLDSPGVIPMAFHNQVAAQRLAMCNDIGEASYVSSLIAAQLIMQLRTLPASAAILERIGQRYGVDPLQGTGEDVVAAVAAKMFQGESERAGIRILKDFRELQFGNIALELPSMVELSPG